MDNKRKEIFDLMNKNETSMKVVMFFREDGKREVKIGLMWMSATFAVFFIPMIFPILPNTILSLVGRAVLIGMWGVRGWHYLWHGFSALQLCYLTFYRRLLNYELQWKAVPIKKPSMYYILFKDVQAYEEELWAYVRHYRRNLDRWVREERWANEGNKLTKELQVLVGRFKLSPEEREKIFGRWESIFNPSGKKRFLSLLESQLAHQNFLSRRNTFVMSDQSLEPTLDEGETDLRLSSLDTQASFVAGEESRQLVEAAKTETNRRKKIRLLKQAVRLDEQTRQALVSAEMEMETKAEFESKPSADIHFLSLQDLARERFNLIGCVPPKIDATMAREIILALLAPGKAGRRFQAAYRAEDTLKVFVRRQYEVHLRKQCNPRVFGDTLAWLVKGQVLFTKPKTDEQVYSLSSKTKGKSEEAQKVIRAFLDFDRSLHVV